MKNMLTDSKKTCKERKLSFDVDSHSHCAGGENVTIYRLEGVMGEDLPAKVVVLALASASSGWSTIMMVMVVDDKNSGKPPTRRLCRLSGQNLALESASGN